MALPRIEKDIGPYFGFPGFFPKGQANGPGSGESPRRGPLWMNPGPRGRVRGEDQGDRQEGVTISLG